MDARWRVCVTVSVPTPFLSPLTHRTRSSRAKAHIHVGVYTYKPGALSGRFRRFNIHAGHVISPEIVARRPQIRRTVITIQAPAVGQGWVGGGRNAEFVPTTTQHAIEVSDSTMIVLNGIVCR